MLPGLQDLVPLDVGTLLLIRQVAITLGTGLLIGLEREYNRHQDSDHHAAFAGIRTFMLVTLTGYLSMVMGELVHPAFIPVMAGGILLLAGLAYWVSARAGDHGGTSEMALVLAFLIGCLVRLEYEFLAVSLTVVITFILAQKFTLHGWIRQLNRSDILAILLFIVLTALLLPWLPDRDFGPFGIFNLYRNWLLVVIFLTLHFLTYFLGKFLARDRSILLTGILGGLASSTATAWFFARRSRSDAGSADLPAAAIIFASSLMFVRILVWLAFLSPKWFHAVWPGILLLAGIGFIIGIRLYRKAGSRSTPSSLPPLATNPVNLKEAIWFAGLFLAVKWAVNLAHAWLGNAGIALASALAGLTDMDAITISLADQTSRSEIRMLTIGLLIAALVNTLVKYGLCLALGSQDLRHSTSRAFLAVLVPGFLWLVWVWAGN